MATLRLPPLPTVRDLVKLYKLQARKQLSQNFLMDERLTNKIVKHAGLKFGAQVMEVGPGPGGITRSIMRKNPRRIIVVEKDKRFGPTLQMLTEAFSTIDGKLDVIFDDVMRFKMTEMFPPEEKKEWNEDPPNIHLIGNLPFSVSTPLIINWLHSISKRTDAWSMGRVRMTLTFQKEVAERLVAKEGEDQRCRLSVMAQAWTKPKFQFTIPGKAFVPKPDVDVGVVSFTPLKVPLTNHEFELFEKVTRHIFSFRQKFSSASVGTLFPFDVRKEFTALMFNLSDINPKTRAFELTVDEISRLTSAYKYLCEKHPDLDKYEYRASRKVISPVKYTKSVIVEEYGEDNLMQENDFYDVEPIEENTIQIQ